MGLDMYLYARRNLPEETELTGEERDQFNRYDEAFVSGYEFRGEESQERYQEIVRAAGLEAVVDPSTPMANIVSDGDDQRDGFALNAIVAYWRKENHIHAWFVDHYQGGEDDCRYSDPIPREGLLELRSLCARILGRSELEPGIVNVGYKITPEQPEWEPIEREGLVIANPELAQEHLPTQSGFFFGGTDYDEYYARGLQSTIEQIDRVLGAPEDTVFTYHSSW